MISSLQILFLLLLPFCPTSTYSCERSHTQEVPPNDSDKVLHTFHDPYLIDVRGNLPKQFYYSKSAGKVVVTANLKPNSYILNFTCTEFEIKTDFSITVVVILPPTTFKSSTATSTTSTAVFASTSSTPTDSPTTLTSTKEILTFSISTSSVPSSTPVINSLSPSSNTKFMSTSASNTVIKSSSASQIQNFTTSTQITQSNFPTSTPRTKSMPASMSNIQRPTTSLTNAIFLQSKYPTTRSNRREKNNAETGSNAKKEDSNITKIIISSSVLILVFIITTTIIIIFCRRYTTSSNHGFFSTLEHNFHMFRNVSQRHNMEPTSSESTTPEHENPYQDESPYNNPDEIDESDGEEYDTLQDDDISLQYFPLEDNTEILDNKKEVNVKFKNGKCYSPTSADEQSHV